MDIVRGSGARITATARWGLARVWLGGNKEPRPRRCAKCGGRYKHRKHDCKGVLSVGCIGYHVGKECKHG